MIVSWKWLAQYVDLDISHDELVERLTMSGLNHEGTESIDGDRALDLEVTSNRPDCLGHIGVAREISVLLDRPLRIPDPNPPVSQQDLSDLCRVEIQCPELCYRYTARLLRGVKIGPSPDWMQDRLETLGVAVINNVVDATNYVMFECGQPLHAFDFAQVKDGTIIVREPRETESFVAIDHKTYQLESGMCVIADSQNAVAIGGVMGGKDSEVSQNTTEVLLEAAYFNPVAVRNTARKLNLHSPSSFRFERDVDSAQIDWASRRCCELILDSGGGELVDGFVDAGIAPVEAPPIVLRLSQLERLLGIRIPDKLVPKILTGLGLELQQQESGKLVCRPPSWRKDITREVDLVEEVGRIYGYEHVPDDQDVPMAASHRPASDRVLDTVRRVLTANGFDEAMTPSLVPEPWSEAFSPWTQSRPLVSSQPMLGVLEKASQNIGAVENLRRSLIPSLLEARRINEFRANLDVELFETAKVYLAQSDQELPHQPALMGLISERSYLYIKGVIESLVEHLNPQAAIIVERFDHELLDPSRAARLKIGEQTLGFLGEVSVAGKEQFSLRRDATVAELDLGVLAELAVLIPQHQNLSLFPAVTRDFNFIVDDSVHWSAVKSAVVKAGGPLLESVEYRETFRDETRDGPDKKRLLLTVVLRSDETTLTGDQADQICQAIVDKCQSELNASLVA